MLNNLRNRIQAAATCYEPRRLSGRSLASIAIQDMTCNEDDDSGIFETFASTFAGMQLQGVISHLVFSNWNQWKV